MLSRFFIYRPVLATVVAFITILMGFLCVPKLEIARFPNIAPPSVRLTLRYNGASAITIENSVVQVVEQQMSGLDGLLYFSSRSTSEGDANISFSFDPSIDPDVAQMQIQNRLQNIMSRLPQAVQDNGVSVRKVSEDTLQRIAFYCVDGSMSQEDISDFVVSVLQDQLSRINGVGSVSVFGSAFAVRIWLNLDKLASYKLNPQDVVNALSSQNRQISSGQLGALPNDYDEPINITIKSREMLSSIEDFEKVVLKSYENGATVYLKDVARIEFGRESYTFSGNYNGYPVTAVSIDLTDGANAVETAQRIEDFLESVRHNLPEGLQYAIPYDTVPFVTASLHEVLKTLCEALLLVALVILMFLRDLRATLIVCLTIPIVISATFSVLYLLGYSINTLTLFGIVLSIGLLVDDAIVVVENINRLMVEQDLSPKDAALKSMSEISSALFGVGLVIAAVFIPMGFFSGATGKIYRQFSVSIVSAMLFSIAVALIITPSWCARYLKKPLRRVNLIGHRKSDIGVRLLELSREKFLIYVDYLLKHLKLCFMVSVVLGLISIGLAKIIPSSFLPTEDQGILFANITMPAGASQKQTREVANEVQSYFEENEKDNIEGIMASLGFSGGGSRGQSVASVYVKLKKWDDRPGDENTAMSIKDRAYAHFKNHESARINVVLPSGVRGMGPSAGFSIQIQNIMGIDRDTFVKDINEIVTTANQSGVITNVRSDSMPDSPQLIMSFNDSMAISHHLSPEVINNNVSVAWAGKYVNDFLDRGRIKRVYVQADAKYRTSLSDLFKMNLVNSQDQLVPLNSVAKARFDYGPVQSQRFNGISSIPISGDPVKGISSGQAMDAIAKIVSDHPNNYAYAWQGQSFQEKLLGAQSTKLFFLSALIVFLILAALYESWTIPVSVIFIIPFGILGALLFVFIRSLVNDVYLQIGLLTSGALACKNAILLIEYAHKFNLRGLSLIKSAKKAASIRFRPIVMTSVAFLLGVFPLMFATGAGAASQISIGTAIVGGTLFATFVGVSFIPGFFVMVSSLFLIRKWRLRKRKS